MSNHQIQIGTQDMPDKLDTRSDNQEAWKSVVKGTVDARHAQSHKMNVGGDVGANLNPMKWRSSVNGETIVRLGRVEMTEAQARQMGLIQEPQEQAPAPDPRQPSADPAPKDAAKVEADADDGIGDDEVDQAEFSQEDLGSLMNSAAEAIGADGIAAAVEAIRYAEDFDGDVSSVEIAQLVDAVGPDQAATIMAGAEQLIGQAVGHSIQALRLGNLTEAQQDSLAAHVDAAPTSVFVDALKGQPAALKLHIAKWKK